mmetsp:Transcript_7642/g.11858  ORF Transcript_7642/g.11858 Transcript_7642/m.11858 type:complete len:227 (-) Transcript_7642:651-1331(-)
MEFDRKNSNTDDSPPLIKGKGSKEVSPDFIKGGNPVKTSKSPEIRKRKFLYSSLIASNSSKQLSTSPKIPVIKENLDETSSASASKVHNSAKRSRKEESAFRKKGNFKHLSNLSSSDSSIISSIKDSRISYNPRVSPPSSASPNVTPPTSKRASPGTSSKSRDRSSPRVSPPSSPVKSSVKSSGKSPIVHLFNHQTRKSSNFQSFMIQGTRDLSSLHSSGSISKDG